MTEQPNFYVVTLRGDRGPLSRQDLVEQLRAGEIAAGDRVRNAFGRPLGTVAEVLGMEAAQRPSAVRPEPARRPASRPAATPARRGLPPMAIAVAVALVLVVVIAVAAMSSSPAAPVVAAPTVSAPVMAPKPVADRPAPAPPRAAVTPEHKPGLLLDIYRLDGEPRDFPIFASTTKPDWSGIAEGVSHEVCQKHGFHENFYARWSGSLDLLKAGDYEFFLFSDDGSRLLIDGKVVVDNGGLHGGEERAGRCTLSAGPHAVRVEYFQGTGGLVLRWQWQPAGFPRDDVPGSVLVH